LRGRDGEPTLTTSGDGPRPFPGATLSGHSPLLDSLRILAWMGLPGIGGWAIWAGVLRERQRGEELASSLAGTLGSAALLLVATPLMILVVWVAPIPTGNAVLLPLIGVTVHVVGGLAGWGAARALREPVSRHGVYLLGGACSNVLTFGGITVVLLLSSELDPHAERALGQMAVYRLGEMPYYFLVVWPVAAAISRRGETTGPKGRRAIARTLLSPRMAPVTGIVVGAVLNLSQSERPEAFDGLADGLVKTNVVLLGLTVGISLRRSSPARNLRPCLAISAIKFVVMPVVGVGLATLAGLDGMSVQVIAICASMPVAFMAVLASVLYRLDDELVGSFWLFTTLAMIVVVPTLAFLLPLLEGGA